MNSLVSLVLVVVQAADPVPADGDVKAGWVAFAVFIALAIAVVLLGISLTRHLRRVSANQEAGVFDAAEEARTRRS